jgi:opacity protein-like surface antigen
VDFRSTAFMKFALSATLWGSSHAIPSKCFRASVSPLAFLSLIACCIGAFAIPAYAEDLPVEDNAPSSKGSLSGLYVTAGVGANWPIDRVGKGDPGSFTEFSAYGFSTEVGIGYDFKPVRIELAYALDASKLQGYNNVAGKYYKYNQGGQTRKNSAFASIYWDLLPSKRLSPYIGAGIGLALLDVGAFAEPGLSYQGYSKSLLGYQAKAGLSYVINYRSKVFAEAIYRGTSSYGTDDGYDKWDNSSFSSWGAQIGLRLGL